MPLDAPTCAKFGHVRRLIVSCSLAVTVASIACDGGIPQPDPAKAEAEEAKVDEEALARRKAEREAKQREKEEAEERLIAEKQRLCVAPDPMPKDAPSCQQVAEAHDAYIRRAGDPDTVAKWDEGGGEEMTAMTVVRCTQAGSSKVAACQKNALDNAGKELLPHVNDLLQTCIDKYGLAGGDPGVVPPKPG